MGNDMMQMQREAEHRVRQMQERSRRIFEEREHRTPESLAAARPGAARSLCPPPEPPPVSPGKVPDTERLLLLGLALLLFRSGEKPELALALVYLAL